MGGSFLDPFLHYLLYVEVHHLRQGLDVGQVQACITDIRFLKMSLWWFVRCDKDDLGEENSENLKSLIRSFGRMWKKLIGVLEDILDESEYGRFKIELMFSLKSLARIVENEAEEVREIAVDYKKYVEVEHNKDESWIKKDTVEHWNMWSSQFEGTIEDCKVQISGYCSNLLHCTFNYSNSTPSADQILFFLDALLKNLKALRRCSIEGTQAVRLKNQMEMFEEKRILLHAYFKLVPDHCLLELRDFRRVLYDDINRVALLIFIFWAKAEDKDIAAELSVMLSDMSRKIIKPSVPDIASWYLGVLKAMQLQRPDDALLLGQSVPAFLDLLFVYMGFPLNADFLILRDGLVILFTFLANPPNDYAEDEDLFFILDQIGDLLRQGSRLIPPFDDTKKVNLSNCVVKIERLRGKIRKLHSFIPDSSLCNFPRTNGLGFMDFLLQNLKENLKNDKMFIPSAKHLIIKIEQELISLRPDLNNVFELQKEHKELQEIWLQLINLAYLTEIVVNSCYVVVYPVGYNMVCLSEIIDEVQVIKGKLDIIKHSSSYNATDLPKSLGSKADIPTQAWYSGANELLVGCDEEEDMIVDQLIRGSKSLEIVSIVGMGGSGKTTLARKVYDNQQVRSSFKIFSFCTVSQVYSTRKLFLEVLKNINSGFVDDDSMTDEDLAHLLKRQLSDRSYLVVMDDIWEIDAWEKLKSSFPNYNNGSRVIFTTRELEVATKAKSKVHLKHLLTDKQSWELLQTEAFSQAGCPPYLFGIGQVIAKNCKGLPLSVVVIGRLLARNVSNLTLWNEIAENTTSFASEEGCVKVLELSYKHLPEHLKSCFLYVGVFAEDELIRAKKLILLWIAEGFVQKPQTESVEMVAKEYLSELVERSLLQVAERSSNTIGIKTCQVHDVIRDFCRRKAHEENFFQLIHRATACNSSVSNQYRLSIHMDWEPFTDAEHRGLGTKSLLYNKINKWSYSYARESVLLKFQSLQILQILDLENVKLKGVGDEVDRIIACMVSLVYLRYLAITLWDTNTVDIPSRMVDLKNLGTFIIRTGDPTCEFWWRETFWRMDRLRHLNVGCYHLIPCPPKFETYPPLYNLECFSMLMLEARTSEKILQRLPNLRKLSCVFNPDEDNESILALDVLTKLQSLKLDVGFGILNMIFNVIFPKNLKKLSLHGKYLPSQQLGKLQHLEVLKIVRYHEERWDIEVAEFPMLKFLLLEDSELREWNVAHGSFPRLEQLVFYYCEYLSEIPASFAESTTLRKIEVVKCSSILASSAREIRDEQEDLGNEIELIISDPLPDPLPDSSEEDPEDSE